MDQEFYSDSDDSISNLSGSSPLLLGISTTTNKKKERFRKNLRNFLNLQLKRMIQFLRTQEHQYFKISKKISTQNTSDFDFMTQEIEESWEDVEGREDMIMIDITKEDSTEEMKNVLDKINKLTKMLTSMNEVNIYFFIIILDYFIVKI